MFYFLSLTHYSSFYYCFSNIGRIKPASMTLLMGPPGCGKSTLLKVLSGRMNLDSNNHLDGSITYGGQTEKDKNFLLAKLVSYVDELDEHIPLLTVKETLEFAWSVTTGRSHSYLITEDPLVEATLVNDDKLLARVIILSIISFIIIITATTTSLIITFLILD